MKIFFGAAIQGHKEWGDRRGIYCAILGLLKRHKATICTEHTTGKDLEEIQLLQEKAIGPMPRAKQDRINYVREKMIGFVEGDLDACVFEMSTPSLGTGIEFTHAYLRPRLGLSTVPILVLYQEGFWPNELSTMIRGLNTAEFDHVSIKTWKEQSDLAEILAWFVKEKVHSK